MFLSDLPLPPLIDSRTDDAEDSSMSSFEFPFSTTCFVWMMESNYSFVKNLVGGTVSNDVKLFKVIAFYLPHRVSVTVL